MNDNDDSGAVFGAIFIFGGVVGALLYHWLIGYGVDPDLQRIQQQRNAWAQYQEAGEVKP